MSRRREPVIPDAILDQLLVGADAKTAFDPNGLIDAFAARGPGLICPAAGGGLGLGRSRHSRAPFVDPARQPLQGEPESTGPTGKRSAVKVARSVWNGGKAAKPLPIITDLALQLT